MQTTVGSNGTVSHDNKIVGFVQNDGTGRHLLYPAVPHIDGAGQTIKRGRAPLGDVQQHWGQKTLCAECARLLGLAS